MFSFGTATNQSSGDGMNPTSVGLATTTIVRSNVFDVDRSRSFQETAPRASAPSFVQESAKGLNAVSSPGQPQCLPGLRPAHPNGCAFFHRVPSLVRCYTRIEPDTPGVRNWPRFTAGRHQRAPADQIEQVLPIATWLLSPTHHEDKPGTRLGPFPCCHFRQRGKVRMGAIF